MHQVSAVKALNYGASRWTTSHMIHRQDVVDDEPHDSPARREAGTDAGRGAEWWNGGDTTGRGKVMDASVSAVEALNYGASRWTTSHMIHRQDVKPARMHAAARSGGTEVALPAVAKRRMHQ